MVKLLVFVSFLLRSCPSWLMALLALAHAAFALCVIAYPFMASNNFNGWWLAVRVAFGVSFVGWYVCGIAALIVKVRHG